MSLSAHPYMVIIKVDWVNLKISRWLDWDVKFHEVSSQLYYAISLAEYSLPPPPFSTPPLDALMRKTYEVKYTDSTLHVCVCVETAPQKNFPEIWTNLMKKKKTTSNCNFLQRLSITSSVYISEKKIFIFWQKIFLRIELMLHHNRTQLMPYFLLV